MCVYRDKDIEAPGEITFDDTRDDLSASEVFTPEHVQRFQFNLVPTNPTGLALVARLPVRVAMSAIASGDQELEMQK